MLKSVKEAASNYSLSFSTCVKSSSTGVARPKMLTETDRRVLPSSTCSTTPVNELNGPSDNLDRLACLERNRRAWTLGGILQLLDHTLGFGVGDRRRLAFGTQKSRDFRNIFDQVPGRVIQIHTNQDIALGILCARPAVSGRA
jgi:hypothetical protein